MSGLNEQTGTGTARIPMLHCDEMSAEQRALYDEIVAGPRGRLVGPLRAAIHSPEMATLWSRLGEFLRFRTIFPTHLKELVIIATARRWNSQVEWLIHAEVALEAGLSPKVLEAILEGKPVRFADEIEREVYEFARELQTHGKVPEDVHRTIMERWGVRGVVELTAIIGYYTMVAMTLNAHEIPLPDGIDAPLPPEETLFPLSPAIEFAKGK